MCYDDIFYPILGFAFRKVNFIRYTDDLNFERLSLTAVKRLEMNSQVHVLELESSLVRERARLAALRRTHYSLAGESEGWEQVEHDGQQQVG